MEPSSSSASAQVTLPPPLPGTDAPQDAYEAATRSLSLPLASQAQIIRSHQRDSAQVWRLTELASDLIRSVTGIRWLAHHQAVVDLLVRTIYLVLTFGRGGQTLGEEYTDILPYADRRRHLPTRRRRLLTILLLLLPTVLTNPIIIQRLRSPDGASGKWQGARSRLAAFLESPLARILPELHLVAFMFRGRFFEIARRITGLSYLSTLPPRPPEQQHPSYEPLGLLMLIPLATRLLYRERGSLGSASTSSTGHTVAPNGPLLPISPPMTPPASNEQAMLLTRPQSYDTPNTYLTPDAQAISERQCTLCLEPRGTGEGSGGTVAVTECGHVFCWGCLGGLDKAAVASVPMIRRDSANSTTSTRSSCASLRDKARPASPVESVPSSSSSSGRKRYESPYPAPSIDSTISSPPRSPPPSNPSPSRYVSFDEILQNAGFEHTRIITPPSEKQRRRILQFDDAEEGRYEPGEQPHADINTHVNWHRSHDLMRYAVFKHERAEAERLAKESNGVLGKSWKDRIFRMPAHEEQKPSPRGEKKFKEAAKALPDIGLGLNKGGQGMRRALSQRSLQDPTAAKGLDSPTVSDDGSATIRPEKRTRPLPFGDASARENSLSTPIKVRSGDLKNKVLVAKVTDTPSSPSSSKTRVAVTKSVAVSSAPSPTARPKRPILPTAESDDSQLTIVPPDDVSPGIDDLEGHYVEEDLGEDLSVDGMDVFDTSIVSTTISATPAPVSEGFTSRFAWDGGFGFSSSHSADDLKMLMSRFDEFGREMQEIEAANAAQEALARQQREGSSESPALRKFRSWHFPTRRPDDTFRLSDYDHEVIEDAPSTILPSSETNFGHRTEPSSPIEFESSSTGFALEDNGYGYEPLPADYDAMEDDEMYGDEVLREINSYRGTDSTRSSTPESASVRSNQTSSTRSVTASLPEQHVELTPDTSLESEEAFGKRVLQTAVAYDGYESPESLHESLPDIETILNGGQARAGPSTSRAEEPFKPTEITPLLSRKRPEPTASQKLVKQYQSTPALTKRKTWAESLREGFMTTLGYSAAPEPVPTQMPTLKTKESKFKLSSPSIASAQVTVYPVTCDTTASAPPVDKFRAIIDTPPRPSSPTATSSAAPSTSIAGQVGAGVLKARKSLSALSAQFGLSSETKPAETYLAPQSMWYTDGVMFKAWDKRWARESPELSTAEDRRFELDTPYRRNMIRRTYENDGFWFPDPVPPAPTPKRQTSIDRLKHHLTWGAKEVAPPPPVPQIPARFQKAKRGGVDDQPNEPSSSSSGGRTTPTLAPTRLAKVPSLILMSPGAYEEGRPGRELVLDGPEFEAREVSKKRGVRRKGSKKGMGKKKAAAAGARPMGAGAMFAQHQDAACA